jgi:class 3 adenylate cyclase
METKSKNYNFKESFKRIDDILDESDKSFEESKSIPSRNNLTYKNGFYVDCSAIAVTLRGSTELPGKFTLPVLTKIYRSFISETVAILNSNSQCVDIRINGDCLTGIYNTPHKADIDSLFSDAAKITSLVNTLSRKLEERGQHKVSVAIGMDYGRSLMVKAGYAGSGINEIFWIGGVFNRAAQLRGYASKNNGTESTFVSNKIFVNLSDYHKKLLRKHPSHNCYLGDVVNVTMDEWKEKQSVKCKPRTTSKTDARKKRR